SAAVIVDGRLNPERVLRPPPSEELRGSIAVENVIPAGQSNVLARTGLVRELGGFNESYRYLADWEMWIRLAGAGAAAACPDVHVAYVMHDTSMHAVHRIPRTEFDKLASEYLGDRAARRKAKIFEAKWRAHGHRPMADVIAIRAFQLTLEVMRTARQQTSCALYLAARVMMPVKRLSPFAHRQAGWTDVFLAAAALV